jgi:RecA/RadA recombinase
MTINIIGNFPKVERQVTGLYTFDRAFINNTGVIGFPLGTGVEIFGANHVGKTTVTLGLSGLIASAQEYNIAWADFEGSDPEYILGLFDAVKYSGDLHYIREATDEEALDSLVVKMFDKKANCGVGIIDSIGAISPISEREGDLGDANMGRRAFLIGQFSRKGINTLRGTNKIIFAINHEYPIIGGRGKDTPGGEVKKYLFSVRIQLKRKYLKGKWLEYPDGSYIIEGKVIKNRWGYKDRQFNLFVLAGKGIHLGLTAMYDCVTLKLATAEKSVKLGETSFGYIKNMTDKAQEGNEAFFMPFIEALSKYNNEESTSSNDEEKTDENNKDIGTETDTISDVDTE